LDASAAVLTTDGAAMPEAAVTWASDAPDVATVDATGHVELRAPGTTTLRASAGDAQGEITLQVAAARPAALTVDATRDSLRVGDVWRPAVTVRDRRGALLDVPVALEPLQRDVAHVTEAGEVEAVAVGATTLRISVGELTEEVDLAITRAAVASLEVEASEPEPELGDRLRCTARALDRRGAVVADAPVRWHSSDARVATVDDAGEVTTARVGTAAITAEADGRRASVSLRVRRPAVARLELEVPTVALRVGEQTRLRAVARDRRGTALDARDRPVRWAVSDAAVLEVAPDGAAEAMAPGRTEVTAECEGQRAHAEVSVIAASITGLFRPVPAPSPPVVVEPEPEEPIESEPENATLLMETAELRRVIAGATASSAAPPAEQTAVPAASETLVTTRSPHPSVLLTAPLAMPAPAPPATEETASPAAPGRRRLLSAVVAAGALLALGGWWLSTRRPAPVEPQVGSAAPSVATVPASGVATEQAAPPTPKPPAPTPPAPTSPSTPTTAPRTTAPATAPAPTVATRPKPTPPDGRTTDTLPPPSRDPRPAPPADEPRQKALIDATVAAVVQQLMNQDAAQADHDRPATPGAGDLEPAERTHISAVVSPLVRWLRESRPELRNSRLDAVNADTITRPAQAGATADATLSLSWRPNRFSKRKRQDLVLRVVLMRDARQRWGLHDVWLVERPSERP
jgi:uncharacterized protein YjdB